MVHSWAVSALSAAVAIENKIKVEAEAGQARGRNTKNSTYNKNSTYSTNSTKNEIQQACKQPLMLRLQQLLCGAAHVLRRRDDRVSAADNEQQVQFSPSSHSLLFFSLYPSFVSFLSILGMLCNKYCLVQYYQIKFSLFSHKLFSSPFTFLISHPFVPFSPLAPCPLPLILMTVPS